MLRQYWLSWKDGGASVSCCSTIKAEFSLAEFNSSNLLTIFCLFFTQYCLQSLKPQFTNLKHIHNINKDYLFWYWTHIFILILLQVISLSEIASYPSSLDTAGKTGTFPYHVSGWKQVSLTTILKKCCGFDLKAGLIYMTVKTGYLN